MKKIIAIFGTRPEAIKVIPVVKALKKEPGFKVRTIVTAQHREMLDQVLDLFKIRPEHDLNIMTGGQTLEQITSKALDGCGRILAAEKPDMVLVQGDTTTTFVAALAAFYHKIPIGYIESGLRSHKKYEPYPEEMNRCMTTRLADLHFAPTAVSLENLLAEGIAKNKVIVTGNTVVDALDQVKNKLKASSSLLSVLPKNFLSDGHDIITVTAHRRENWGAGIQNICLALKIIAEKWPSSLIVFSVHLNPKVKLEAERILTGVPNITLIDPINYFDFIYLMSKSRILISDSGGVQEEAPSLKVPVLILRNVTERPEGVAAGVTKLVGTNKTKIVNEALKLLTDPKAHGKMTHNKNPYGDGKAAQRIVKAMRKFLGA